jgi:hypothetical protein
LVVCRVSCVVCRVSCVVCRVSCVVCRVSCVVSCPTSALLFVLSNVRSRSGQEVSAEAVNGLVRGCLDGGNAVAARQLSEALRQNLCFAPPLFLPRQRTHARTHAHGTTHTHTHTHTTRHTTTAHARPHSLWVTGFVLMCAMADSAGERRRTQLPMPWASRYAYLAPWPAKWVGGGGGWVVATAAHQNADAQVLAHRRSGAAQSSPRCALS